MRNWYNFLGDKDFKSELSSFQQKLLITKRVWDIGTYVFLLETAYKEEQNQTTDIHHQVLKIQAFFEKLQNSLAK